MSALARMKKGRTTNIQEIEVDFRVLRFTCHDSSVLSSLGKHCKEMRWLIAVSHEPRPIDICVTVDKQVLTSPEISVVCNAEQVYPPTAGSKTKAKLTKDFTWRKPFRGLIRGIQVPDYFEIRPDHMNRECWFLATVNQQREDGTFQVTVKMPNGSGGFRNTDFPVVRADSLREFQSKAPVTLPQCALVLSVPVSDPLHATLDVARDGAAGELITHFFNRPTPKPPNGMEKPQGPDPKVTFNISKDRRTVTADVGYATLEHFLSGQVRTVSRDCPSKLKKVWCVQVGPNAKHTIELKKESAKSKIVTLSVDDEILCEASAEDIESREDWWECNFRLSGQKFLEWKTYMTNVDGVTTDTQGQVLQRTVFAHQCSVSFVENIQEATLHIDNVEYRDLPDSVEPRVEELLKSSPEGLLGSFGLTPPYQVDPQAPTGLRMSMKNGAAGGGLLGGLFSCCESSPVDRSDEVIPPVVTTN